MSQDYRDRYADNLSKELPRIPCIKTAKVFWCFSQAGRALAEFHLNYETVDKYPVKFDCGKRSIKQLTNEEFRVTKMKRPKIKGANDNTTIIYNDFITLKDIPIEAYDYVVNGKASIISMGAFGGNGLRVKLLALMFVFYRLKLKVSHFKLECGEQHICSYPCLSLGEKKVIH